VLLDCSLKRADARPGRRLERTSVHVVQRNQVDVSEQAIQQTGDLVGLRQAVVHVAHHRVLEGNPPVSLRDVLSTRVDELGELVLAVDRDQSIAQVVGWRVQRDGQSDLERPGRELADARRESGRGGASARPE